MHQTAPASYALPLNDAHPISYHNLATVLSPSERVTLPDGRSMDDRELYLESLRYKAADTNAYVNLANILSSSEHVTLPDGRSRGEHDWYLETLRSHVAYAAS